MGRCSSSLSWRRSKLEWRECLALDYRSSGNPGTACHRNIESRQAYSTCAEQRPSARTNRIEPLANAIVEGWQPGINGGNALAGILSGRINPSGRLSITFPYSTGQIPIYYNRRQSGRHNQGFYQDITSEPFYPFGHGLSYTTYAYGDLKATKSDINGNEKIKVSIPVTNTGNVAGDETVMWFVQDPVSSITRPVKELRHFEKKRIEPGETVVYTFEINPMRDLSFVDAKGCRFVEPGEFRIIVKDKTITLNYSQSHLP